MGWPGPLQVTAHLLQGVSRFFSSQPSDRPGAPFCTIPKLRTLIPTLETDIRDLNRRLLDTQLNGNEQEAKKLASQSKNRASQMKAARQRLSLKDARYRDWIKRKSRKDARDRQAPNGAAKKQDSRQARKAAKKTRDRLTILHSQRLRVLAGPSLAHKEEHGIQAANHILEAHPMDPVSPRIAAYSGPPSSDSSPSLRKRNVQDMDEDLWARYQLRHQRPRRFGTPIFGSLQRSATSAVGGAPRKLASDLANQKMLITTPSPPPGPPFGSGASRSGSGEPAVKVEDLEARF
ncbi:Uu.00g046920.m01.CDS01 [Anthostomella pinea]|uniref:Uu.00g046920.m01.CDS01 n=1 Tax=Anthostomella pinea TaxID=933095 RepID=A0AAI8YC52_9PEZI|nr:Uu.00g046920.m01.CDS01 [Anthostomella pinea]